MNRLLTILAIALLSGCSMLEAPIETSDVVQGTTTVDAVEGDKSQDESSGIVDTLRGRTDPVAGDPAWAPIHPKHQPEHYAAETGSLFNTVQASSLYDDSKPRGVGDIITVTLDENTKAAKARMRICRKTTTHQWTRLKLVVNSLTLAITTSHTI